MTKREQAKKILQAIEEKAPIVVNWNNEEMWIDAIVTGMNEIEKEENDV